MDDQPGHSRLTLSYLLELLGAQASGGVIEPLDMAASCRRPSYSSSWWYGLMDNGC